MKLDCRWGVYYDGYQDMLVMSTDDNTHFCSVFITDDTIDVIELKIKQLRRNVLKHELDDIMQKTNTSKTK